MKGVGVTEENSRPFGYFWGNAKSNKDVFGYFLCIKTKKVTSREMRMNNKKH